ncbi:LysR family transcriptional regulator [Polaromonas sp. UC242_47]|uniref:LysR family transcriptional regulator n=1 Tax=Polaromonas sp. UC242_47 TaxID=3374626 RepID=UPI003799CBD1
MKLHQLRYLVSIADCGSIRAASRTLGVTQAAITKGLRELEAECGVALFERNSSGISFTEAGRALQQHAHLVVEQMAKAGEDMAQRRNPTAAARLSIGVTPWIAQALLPRVLHSFRAEMPHVQLELFEGLSAVAYPRLRDGAIDLLLGRIPQGKLLTDLDVVPLFSYSATVVARAGHPQEKARSIHELADEEWILNFTQEEQSAWQHDLFLQHGAPLPKRIHIAHSASLMLNMVQHSDMLTLCPWPLVETDLLRNAGVQALLLKEEFALRTVGTLRRRHETPSLPAQRFLAHFAEQIEAGATSSDPELRRVFRSIDRLR